MEPLDEFVTRVFRASPNYELVLYDRLPDAERDALADLRADPNLYGLLKPRGGAQGKGTIKTVGRDTALLVLTLHDAGPLPSYVGLANGTVWQREIAQLVLDGVLEIMVGSAFVSGPAAATVLNAGPAAEPATTHIGDLSRQGLRFASLLDTDDPNTLAAALYTYNRVPVSPRRAAAFRGREALGRYLHLTPSGEPGWTRLDPEAPGWLIWRSRAGGTALSAPAPGVTYKLYISPTVAALPEATRPVFSALARARCGQMKIGSGAAGLHRPDKIVAYFTTFEDLADGAERVRREIDGTPAQGVPFSADIDPAGLLSWGMDPPLDPQLQSWRGVESWRAWVTNRLGLALGQYKQSPDTATPPWTFALARVRLEGVDVEHWTPNRAGWGAAVAAGA